MGLRKLLRGLVPALRAPVVMNYSKAMRCDLCGVDVDSEEVVEYLAGPTGAKIGAKVLVKHHGAEELASFDLGTEHWDHEDLARATRGHRWFAPETKSLGQSLREERS